MIYARSFILVMAGAVSAWAGLSDCDAWSVGQFKNLVVFGDSYSDESRLEYFITHNGSAPPTGYYSPESFMTADGGRIWCRYVIQYTGSDVKGKWTPSMTLYDYAVQGAVVSNLETPRYLPLVGSYPDIELYEVPAYLADKKFVNSTTKAGYFQPPINSRNTVAAFFIGTNDLGVGTYLTDSQIPGNNIISYVNKVYDQIDRVYASGIRHFIIFNAFILDLAPLYANASFGGDIQTQYWPDRPSNLTATSLKMGEYIASVNQAYKLQTPFEVILKQRYPGAHFANFDVHSWALEVYSNPSKYFNGTAPIDVKGVVHTCTNQNCSTFATASSPDSYFWYDTLHPSEQTMRNLAREVIRVLDGKSKFSEYYTG